MFNNPTDTGVVQASPYDHNTTQDNPFVVKKQPNKCRDPIFAALLYVNVAAIAFVFFQYGLPALSAAADGADAAAAEDDDVKLDIDTQAMINTAFGTAAVGTVLSGIALQVLMCIPNILIKVALLFNVAMSLVFAAYGFYIGQMFMGIIGLIFFAIFCCYARAVWDRIPFATANLKTGCAAVRANCGVTFVAYFFTALSIGWFFLWTASIAGVQDQVLACEGAGDNQVCSPNYGYLFLLFLSFFFTNEVLKNCVHVTVAGVVGSWWFNPSQNGFCGAAVCGSLYRTLTTSFGSICFGSLLVAIIQAVRQLAETARQNDELGNTLACCIDCILGCLESLLEYFNKWAFVYVGLYGFGYCEAGKNVMTLFKDRGWEAVIADDLVGMVLGMMSIVVGLATGGIGVLFVATTDWFDANDDTTAKIIAFVIGLLIGLVICIILMGVIASAVNTAIVLFADGPAEFEKNHPELSSEMREAYSAAHPGSI